MHIVIFINLVLNVSIIRKHTSTVSDIICRLRCTHYSYTDLRLLNIRYFQSEKANESRNKSIRKFRESHGRTFNREINLEDVFDRLLLTSDPVISLPNRSPSTPVDKNLIHGEIPIFPLVFNAILF